MIAEYLLMGIIFFLSCYVTKTDYSEGIIPNSVIKKALIIACIIDLFYYTFEGKQYLEAFWANVLIVSGLSFLLFKRHIFAGGDCKLVIVLAMLYPGRFYFTYYGKPYTLIIAVVLSIVYGIIFLFMVSIKDLITGKQHLSKGYVIDYIKKFLFSFVKITVYISVISPFIDFIILEKISMSGIVRIWVLRVIIFCCVILVNKHPIFNNKILFLCVLAGDVLVSLKYHFLPFNGGMKRYLFFTFLIFGQIILKNNVYKEIEISSLKKGIFFTITR